MDIINNIRFLDGRKGIQVESQDASGEQILLEIVVTQLADGTPVHQVYGPRRYLTADVFGFQDLGNVTWELDRAQ